MADNTAILKIQARDETKAAYESVEKNMRRMHNTSLQTMSAMDRAGRQSRQGLAQLSYQIQDVSVQLQGGQSPFIVLAQQGSQIASIFGAGGAVIGAIVAVGAGIATALLPRLFDSTTALERLNEATKELDALTNQAADGGIRTLSESFYELARASSLAAKTQLSDAIRNQKEELKAVGAEIKEEIDVVAALLGGGFVDYATSQPGRARANTQMLAQMWGMDEESVQVIVNSAVSALRTGTDQGIKEFSTTLLEVGDQNANVSDSFIELRTRINELYSGFIINERSLNENITVLNEFEEALEKSGVQTKDATDSIEGMIAKLQKQALTLDMSATQIAVYEGILAGANTERLTTIQNLSDEIAARQAAAEAIKQQAQAEERLRQEKERSEEQARRDDIRATEDMLRREERAIEDSYRKQQSAMQTINRESLGGMSETDRLAAEFDERIRITYEALQELGWLETEHANLLISLNQQKAAAIAKSLYDEEDARRQTVQSQISMMSSMASSIASSLEEGTAVQKAAYLVSQGLAFADAIISAELASAKALALFPQNPAYAGMIKAMGYASAGVIAGQTIASFEGGGFTGYGARAGGIDGRGGMPAIVHPNESIIDHTKGGGGVVVNINIQANDTRGFDELLNKRRGMIASMVQSSLNNMGRRI